MDETSMYHYYYKKNDEMKVYHVKTLILNSQNKIPSKVLLKILSKLAAVHMFWMRIKEILIRTSNYTFSIVQESLIGK